MNDLAVAVHQLRRDRLAEEARHEGNARLDLFLEVHGDPVTLVVGLLKPPRRLDAEVRFLLLIQNNKVPSLAPQEMIRWQFKKHHYGTVGERRHTEGKYKRRLEHPIHLMSAPVSL